MVTSLKMMNFDENLPITNKTNHQTKGEKKVQDGRTQVLTNEESSQEGGWITRGIRTNQVPEHAFWYSPIHDSSSLNNELKFLLYSRRRQMRFLVPFACRVPPYKYSVVHVTYKGRFVVEALTEKGV
jgi:hypothetical protein